MFFLCSVVTSFATLGGMMGGAIATLAVGETAVATGSAIGTAAGAGIGLIVGAAESEECC